MRAWVGILLGLGFSLAAPNLQQTRISGLPVSYVKVPLAEYRLEVALAGARVGDNAELSAIARREGAVCALNGTFLTAYEGQIGEPYGTLVIAGKTLHLGSVGTRLDIEEGRLRFVQDGLRIGGTIDGKSGWPFNWYAYNLNRTPTSVNYSLIFTPERGARLGFRAPVAVVAPGGVVSEILRNADAPIPRDGFVVALGGREVEGLASRFQPGQRLEYQVTDRAGNPFAAEFSLGAGPLLLSGGQIVADPAAEGFQSNKVLREKGARSAIGVTAKGELILATIANATVQEEARVMRALGAVEAMNLDGGASSGLFCNGRYAVQPGRKIANALVLIRR